MQAARSAGPIAPGSKPVPDGAPNCLAGLTFVFTGELSAFSREEAQDLAKRFGGRVTGQPSGKTSYVVVGANAGASKLKVLEKLKLTTLDEDGFLNLIATREGVLDEKTKAKLAKDEEKIRAVARELEQQERAETSTAQKGCTTNPSMSADRLTGRTARSHRPLAHSCGPPNMRRKRSKIFAATRARSRSCSNGSLTGGRL